MSTELWYAAIAGALTLVVTVAHACGFQVPILSAILDALHGKPPAKPGP